MNALHPRLPLCTELLLLVAGMATLSTHLLVLCWSIWNWRMSGEARLLSHMPARVCPLSVLASILAKAATLPGSSMQAVVPG